MSTVTDRLSGSFAPENRQLTATLAIVVVALLPYALVSSLLPEAGLGWFGLGADFGIHQIHDMTFAGFLWFGLVALLAQFHRPARKLGLLWGVALAWLSVFVVGTAAAGFDVFFALFAIPPLVAALLHPGTPDAIRELRSRVAPSLGLLALLAAVPLLAFAADQYALQAIGDEHAAAGHWSGMAGIAVGMVVVTALVALRISGWRLLAVLVGLFAAYFGGLSLVFTEVTASNVGTLWGSVAIAWGVAFVLTSEWLARRGTTETPPLAGTERLA